MCKNVKQSENNYYVRKIQDHPTIFSFSFSQYKENDWLGAYIWMFTELMQNCRTAIKSV